MKCFKFAWTVWDIVDNKRKAPTCLISDKTIRARIEVEAKHLGLEVFAPNHCPFAECKALRYPFNECPVNKK